MIPDQRRYEDLHQLLILPAAAFPADATVFVLTVMVGEPGPSASSCCSACGTGTLKSPCSCRGMLLPYPVCSIRPAGCSLPTWCQLQGWQKTRWKEDQKIFISIPSSWPSIGPPHLITYGQCSSEGSQPGDIFPPCAWTCLWKPREISKTKTQFYAHLKQMAQNQELLALSVEIWNPWCLQAKSSLELCWM